MIESSKEDLSEMENTSSPEQVIGNGELEKEPLAKEIDFNAFAAVDLRIALIEKAAFVEGADKLIATLPLTLAASTQRVLRHQKCLP